MKDAMPRILTSTTVERSGLRLQLLETGGPFHDSEVLQKTGRLPERIPSVSATRD